MLPEIYLVIPSYALMATVGLMAAVLYIYLIKDQIRLSFFDIIQYLLCSLIIGFICARLLFVIGIIPSVGITNLNQIIYYFLNGGIVFYGGLIGVIISILLMSKVKNKDGKKILNYIAPAIPLFHAFARFGCLLAGCCYGITSNWGVVLVNEPDVVRLPVQAFESICNIIIFVILKIHIKKKNNDNNLFIYLILYAICRFVLEFFRGDAIRGIWIFGLSTAQLVSVVIIIISVICKLRVKEYNKSHRRIKNVL